MMCPICTALSILNEKILFQIYPCVEYGNLLNYCIKTPLIMNILTNLESYRSFWIAFLYIGMVISRPGGSYIYTANILSS